MTQHSFWSDVQLTSASKERSDGEGGGAGCNQSINDGGNCRRHAAGSGLVTRCAPESATVTNYNNPTPSQIGPARAVS